MHKPLNSRQFGQKDQYKLLERIGMSKIDLVCDEQYQISMVCQKTRQLQASATYSCAQPNKNGLKIYY